MLNEQTDGLWTETVNNISIKMQQPLQDSGLPSDCLHSVF